MHAPPSRKALSIAGTDPLGGAGILADAATFRREGVEALAVPTALVVQDSHGVHSFRPAHGPTFHGMTRAALQDGTPDAIKIGMVASPAIARRLLRILPRYAPNTPAVLDPVLAGGTLDGRPLARHGLVPTLLRLGALTSLVTPNAPELAALLGELHPPRSPETLEKMGAALARRLDTAVLAKGGHVDPPGHDFLASPDGRTQALPSGPAPPCDIHGTGCFLSSTITARLALGDPLDAAIAHARNALHLAFRNADIVRIGSGRPQFAFARPDADPNRD